MTDQEVVFNPFEPGFTDDPYPAYARLRHADPVHESPLGIWLLSRHEDVAALLRSSLSVDPANVTGSVFAEMNAGRTERVLSMLDRDPPDHTRLRSLVARVFTPRSIAALEPLVTRLVDESLDEIAAAGRADIVDALAFPLPFEVISRMLGMPSTDTARVRELSGTIVRSLDIVADMDLLKEIEDAAIQFDAITADVIAWKRANPADDLLTKLIEAEDQGDKLSDEELVAQVELLYIAGHETTVNLIAGGVDALLRHPDQRELLAGNPAGNTVEELLRFVSPVQQSRRITTAPYRIGDREIPPGTFVVAILASANRDEHFWGPDAGELDITRPNARQHVSFGAGVHHCLGAALARLEARVAIERLFARFPALAFDPADEMSWNGRINLRGPGRLPVTVSAANPAN